METNEYCAVYEGGQGEIVEKKSRFIATVLPIETEEEALEFIAKMKKKYWDARHNCYAYVIGERQELQRCSDDGEPNGTAGRPMLDVLLHEDIHNTVVVVTRYFGGVLLGTGGLVRAYQKATRSGLESSVIIEKQRGVFGNIVTDYNGDRKDPVYISAEQYPNRRQYLWRKCQHSGGRSGTTAGKVRKRTDRGYEWKSRDRLGKRGHFCNC